MAGRDTRALPFVDRRALLEELARAWAPPLRLSPVTKDRAVAETWFEEMPATGVEGLMVNSLLNRRVDAVRDAFDGHDRSPLSNVPKNHRTRRSWWGTV